MTSSIVTQTVFIAWYCSIRKPNIHLLRKFRELHHLHNLQIIKRPVGCIPLVFISHLINEFLFKYLSYLSEVDSLAIMEFLEYEVPGLLIIFYFINLFNIAEMKLSVTVEREVYGIYMFYKLAYRLIEVVNSRGSFILIFHCRQ